MQEYSKNVEQDSKEMNKAQRS